MVDKLDFPKKKGYPIRCKVYIPSTQGNKRISKAEHMRRARIFKKKMISLFGGTTSIKASGSWYSGARVINEPVLLVESYTTRVNWNKNDKKIKAYINKKKKEWKQQAISMEWEDLSKNLSIEGMHFI